MGCGTSTEAHTPAPSARPRPQANTQGPSQPSANTRAETNPRDNRGRGANESLSSEPQGKSSSSNVPLSKKHAKQINKTFKQVLKQDDKYAYDAVRNLLVGCPDQKLQNTVKIVRIFTSSTFTDTKHERNMLMEKVYPKLKNECRDLGYEFQVVDMRWGVRDEATDDHTTSEICLKELELCQQLSTGPNFVTFLSHKNGYNPFPRCIEATEFETITQDYVDDDAKLLEKWFVKDVNAVPAEYVLQPISSGFPDTTSNDKDTKVKALDEWWIVQDRLQSMLIQGAEKQKPSCVHNYRMSVTEREITKGILEVENAEKTCLWFKRNIVDIDSAPTDGRLRRYKEIGEDAKAQETRKLHADLEERLSSGKYLPAENIVQYDVHWDDGINPSNDEHKQYLEKLGLDFEDHMLNMIRRAVASAANEEKDDPLYWETLQHSTFRQSKCKSFTGREQVLKKIEEYVKAKNTATPFVLHGISGCGKTSIMAKVATDAWDWLDKKAATIYRFIGTSQESSTIRLLLNSINDQIMAIYAPDLPREVGTMEIKELSEEFMLYISCIPKEKPLVLVLDSLDQLDGADGGKQLDWLPKQLPPNVKIIVSTLPQEKYICYTRCQAMFPENQWVLGVPALNFSDIDGILSQWLKDDKRSLIPEQRQILTDTIEKHALPLMLKLCCDEAIRWHSYDAQEKTVLEATVAAMINSLFNRLEKTHGKILVKHGIGYLTAARNGLTEAELEDILSLSDEVLNDVYQYWTPPVRRLPPLLWVRIKNELKEYVVYRGADGAQVLYWYHRQFIEAAKERYLSDVTFQTNCHKDIAEYFIGTWAGKAKPYKDKKGASKRAERHVSSQPLMFNDKYNIRKLNQLPYHIINSKQRDVLKKEVVCNYEFLLAKMKCVGLRPVLSDLKAAQMGFENDKDISVVLESLQLSSDALTRSPNELAGQLVGRIHDYGAGTVGLVQKAKAALEMEELDDEAKAVIRQVVPAIEKLMKQMDDQQKNLKSLCEQARNASISTLVPHTGFLVPPGGQLLHKLSGHFEKINDIAMSVDGKILVTASDDKSVKLWNIYTGAILRSVDLPAEVKFLVYLSGHRLVASCTLGTIHVIDTQIGEVIKKLKTGDKEYAARPIVAIHIDNKPYIVAPRSGFIDIFDVAAGDLKLTFGDDLKEHKTRLWGEQKVIAGGLNHFVYSAFADDDFYVVPLENFQEINMVKVNVFQEEAEWANLDSKDHICDIAIAEIQKQIIVVNGKTNEFIFFDLLTRDKLSVFNKNKPMAISDLRFSSKEQSYYYTADNEVGQLGVGASSCELKFRHPCKVTRVVSCDGRLVATIAEDNILRVWDKIMEPFKPDMSHITGQVHVGADEKDSVSAMMGDMLGDVDTSSAVTNKEVKNYWTKDAKSSSNDRVYTKFFSMPGNTRYTVAMQYHYEQNVMRQWTRCLSIWETSTVQLVRRVFFPVFDKDTSLGTYYVHCIVDKYHAFVQHNGFDVSFKLLSFKTWKLESVNNTKTAKKVWKSISLHIPGRQVVAVETQYDQLAIFDLNSRSSIAHLSINDKTREWHLQKIGVSPAYRSYKMTIHKFDEIKCTDEEDMLVTVWGHWIVTVWSCESWTQLYEYKMKDHFPSLDAEKQCVSLGNVTNDQYLLVGANVEAKAQNHNSSCVLNIKSGQFTGYTFAHSEVKEKLSQINVEGMGALFQDLEDSPKKLQWVGVGQDGDSIVMDEKIAGTFTNNMRMSEDCARYVTWCSEPQEKTIKLWGVVQGKLKTIGAFTSDEEVSDVHLVNDENMILINTASGLIQLQLCGRNVIPAASSARETAPVDYNDIEIHIQLDTDL